MELFQKSSQARKHANFINNKAFRADFSWSQEFDSVPKISSGGIHMAHVAVDAHAQDSSSAQKVALQWLGRFGDERRLTYAELSNESNAFANGLQSLGLKKEDVVFGLCNRLPEYYVSFFGALKAHCVFSPLFSAFGPEPVAARMKLGRGKALITTAQLYQRKVAPVRSQLPELEHIILVGPPPASSQKIPGAILFDELLKNSSNEFEIEKTLPNTPALLHFTSGTTGLPKGALHVHEAILSHRLSGRLALDLHPQDVFWCTADPGWVTGTSYGILSPLSNGVTMVVDEAEFDARRWYSTLERQEVNVWYTAPTAFRMLMKHGAGLVKEFDLRPLRFIASVGEPLNPEVIRWGLEAFGKAIHDNWWQTETGSIMIANTAASDVALGSMGTPLPGVEAEILIPSSSGYTVAPANTEGQLAIRSPWPSMFRGYLNQEERYQKCFTSDGWYLSGDLARKDVNGRFWFVGRTDDVIKSSGHLIGPFEVENALMEHSAVAEAGVIGIPDATAGQVIKAFVTLLPTKQLDQGVVQSIRAHARKKLGPAVAPRDIVVVDNLPKTRSGKIMRRLLRNRELGLPEGDISTLESDTTSREPNPRIKPNSADHAHKSPEVTP